ncbi:MAG: hypothetical protein AAF821_19360 [Cyanobacteria bacterium P01_D01_bin.156]
MNASTQAVSIGAMSKIASIPVLFRSEFPSTNVDLSPWSMDEQTQQDWDPNSLDFAFSFSDWHAYLSCGCVLLQACFLHKLSEENNSFHGVKAYGHGYRNQYWRFSSVTDWRFYGDSLPTDTCQQQLKYIANQIHALFGCPASLHH